MCIMIKRLWADEAGFIISTELVLVATILVLSMVVGMKKISSQVLAEMSDVANAIGFLVQDYSFTGASFTDTAGCIEASWAGTSVLPDRIDGANGDYVSIDTCVPASVEIP